jgi:multidrug resistance efflux pump
MILPGAEATISIRPREAQASARQKTPAIVSAMARPNQHVKAGDVLIELDPTMNEAESDHLRSDLITARLDAARLRAALSDGSDPLTDFDPPGEASPALISMQRQFLIDQTSEQRAKLAALDRQKAQKEAERATIAATVGKSEQTIPILQQRVDIRKTLFDHSTGSKANHLEILQALVDQQQDLIIQKSRAREADAALAAITETRAQAAAEYRRTLSGELVEAERKAAGLSQDLVKAEQRTKLQLLVAPVDGVVQQLAVHTVGGVVTPAQALLVVVPQDSHLEYQTGTSASCMPDKTPRSRSTPSISHGTASCMAKWRACHKTPLRETRRRIKIVAEPRMRTAVQASQKGRSLLMLRGSRWTARKCRWRTTQSTCRLAWRSRRRSRPGHAGSSVTCFRRC